MTDLPFQLTALAVFQGSVAILVSGHILLHKTHVRSAIGWLGLVWLAPLVGAALYGVFGINRIRRRAVQLRGEVPPVTGPVASIEPAALKGLAELGGRVTGLPLTSGNEVELLVDAEQVYPAMLQAIEQARETVLLVTYIFSTDEIGQTFVEALARAHARGVRVRVLIDGVGAHYSLPTVLGALQSRGVDARLWLFSWNPWRMPFINLRTHRKLLVVDEVAITGGMNLRGGPTRDLMARVRGPVVAQLHEAFRQDWRFTASEDLPPPAVQEGRGSVLARAVLDGPDEQHDRTWRLLFGALAVAKKRVAIVTPYFLPEEDLERILETTALRGIQVDLLLPKRSNLPYLHWAARSELDTLVEAGVRVWWVDGPFDHSKLMVVDDTWTLMGGSNWDTRSLRLNFELNLECHDADVCAQAWTLVAERLARAKPVTLGELFGRSTLTKLMDGAARLGKPYF